MNLEWMLDKLLPSESVEPKNLHKAMRYSVFSGGKRIRPIILIESAKACGGKEAAALPLACAVEFIHTYSLIHDDLPAMDDDNYRRGKPSCHKAFSESTAILAGDALLTLAFQVIAENCTPETAKAAIAKLAGAAGSEGMVGGQEMDLASDGQNSQAQINLFKTAKLFEVSASLGAIAAGAGKSDIESMAEYGLNLGLIFQIADDMADSNGYSWKSRDNTIDEAAGMERRAKAALKRFGGKAGKLLEILDTVYAKVAR